MGGDPRLVMNPRSLKSGGELLIWIVVCCDVDHRPVLARDLGGLRGRLSTKKPPAEGAWCGLGPGDGNRSVTTKEISNAAYER